MNVMQFKWHCPISLKSKSDLLCVDKVSLKKEKIEI